MQGVALARRYARALFLQAQEEGVLEQVTPELGGMAEVLESTELLPFLLFPGIPLESKEQILDRVTENACGLLQRFMKLLLRRGRIKQLPQTYKALLDMEDDSRGIRRAKVTTVLPLDENQMETLRVELRRLMKKEVLLEPRLRPKILGGVIVEVGDYLIDSSVGKEVRSLRDRLKRAKVN